MDASKIERQDKDLQIPDHVILPFIEGDGIGKDITKKSLDVIDKAIESAYGKEKSIEWKEVLAGKKAKQKTGEYLPEKTIKTFREYKVGIKGPLRTPVGGGFRSLNVALRQNLDLFVCLRPVEYIEGLPSPVKNPSAVDLHIFRENTEDIYAGVEYELGTDKNNQMNQFLLNEMGETSIRFPDSSGYGIKPVSKQGSQRLVEAAINYALDKDLPAVTLVHKGNIMKYTEGAFKNWGYEIAQKKFGEQTFTQLDYDRIKEKDGQRKADEKWSQAQKQGKVIVKDVIADAFFQSLLLEPQNHSVIVTMNLNGDYISDMAAAMVGGIGISPGGNINYKNGRAIFEATHGTAPDIAGTGKANPSSFLLSAGLMLSYLGWEQAAQNLRNNVTQQIINKNVTEDLYHQIEGAVNCLSTEEFLEKLIGNF